MLLLSFLTYYGQNSGYFVMSVDEDAFKRGRSRVQDVYEGSWQLDDEIPHLRIHNRTIDWDEGFEKRAKKYSENFNRLRQKKNAKGIRRRARKAV